MTVSNIANPDLLGGANFDIAADLLSAEFGDGKAQKLMVPYTTTAPVGESIAVGTTTDPATLVWAAITDPRTRSIRNSGTVRLYFGFVDDMVVAESSFIEPGEVLEVTPELWTAVYMVAADTGGEARTSPHIRISGPSGGSGGPVNAAALVATLSGAMIAAEIDPTAQAIFDYLEANKATTDQLNSLPYQPVKTTISLTVTTGTEALDLSSNPDVVVVTVNHAWTPPAQTSGTKASEAVTEVELVLIEGTGGNFDVDLSNIVTGSWEVATHGVVDPTAGARTSFLLKSYDTWTTVHADHGQQVKQWAPFVAGAVASGVKGMRFSPGRPYRLMDKRLLLGTSGSSTTSFRFERSIGGGAFADVTGNASCGSGVTDSGYSAVTGTPVGVASDVWRTNGTAAGTSAADAAPILRYLEG